MAIEVSRRGFFKLLGAAAVVSATKQAMALVTGPANVGEPGFAPLPITEHLEYSIDYDASLWRAGCIAESADGKPIHYHINAWVDDLDVFKRGDDAARWFDETIRQPALKELADRARRESAVNLRPMPMPKHFQPLPDALRALA